MTFINDFSKPLKFLVGINGSGKSYALNEALKEKGQYAFLITEDGMPIIPRDINQVSIDLVNKSYNYLDENSRGNLHRTPLKEDISEKALGIVLFCNEIIKKLDLFSTKSKGQEKLYNMMSIFTTYNLNHIEIIFFDEPENFLDEEYLKVIANFFCVLVDNGYMVRVATHNSRLLNILQVNLEDLVFMHTHSQNLILNSEVKELFQDSSEQIENIRRRQNIQINSSIEYKLNLLNYTQAFDSFLEQNLKSESFYRCLFNKKIIIVEGISDIVALSSIKNDFDSSIEIYNPNGKAFIPFFVKLFLKLKKEVFVIIDGDIPSQEGVLSPHPAAITHYLRECEGRGEIKLVEHSPDLEGFYSINLEQIGISLGMSNSVRGLNKGWLKFLAAFIFFNEETNKELLRNHVLGAAQSSLFEFQ